MNMHVAPEGMKSLLERFYDMQYRLRRIESSFKETGKSLDIEIKKDPDIFLQIKEAEKDLEEIVQNSVKYSRFIEFALEEYKKLENRINEMAEQEWKILLSKKSSTSDKKESAAKKVETFRKMTWSDLKGTCPLPKKQLFVKGTVSPGVIKNGRNILIRTWTNDEKE